MSEGSDVPADGGPAGKAKEIRGQRKRRLRWTGGLRAQAERAKEERKRQAAR